MNENRVKRNRLLGDRVIRGLESRNMEGYYAETKEEALKKALELIPEGSSLSWGGSMTIAEIGLKEAVCSGNYKVYNRDAAKNPEEKRAAELAAYDCDFFLTSANAVTEDGEMINVDGFANRVSAIAAGPRRFGLDTPCSENGMCYDCKSPDTICCQILITRFSKIKGRIKVILVDEALGF